MTHVLDAVHPSTVHDSKRSPTSDCYNTHEHGHKVPNLNVGLYSFPPLILHFNQCLLVDVPFGVRITVNNYCRWHFDFQVPSEVLVKRVPNSRRNFRTVKTYTVIVVYRRKLVISKVYIVHTVIN